MHNLFVPIEKKVTRIGKNGEEITKIISYRLQFIESARFMASSFSKLVNNLAERIHKIKCKCETSVVLNIQVDDLIELKYLGCNENYRKNSLKQEFTKTYKFANHEIKKFILLLGKGVYPYKYI